MEKTLSRREELELWREQTGRTYMKRFSYVQQCANPITPQKMKITEPCPQTTCKKPDATKHGRDLHGRVLTRREMLEQWQREKLGKESVKGHQNRGILVPANGTRTGICHHMECKEGTRSKSVFNDTGKIQDRLVMKELFQRDIDETVAEILSEDRENDVSCEMRVLGHVTGNIDPDIHNNDTQKKPRKRCSTAFYVNSELAFLSSTVRYSMVASEYRRGRRRSKRHTCIINTPDDPTKRLLYLTPVRRSTRKSRSMCPEVKGELCFDSPSQPEGYDRVEVIPNDALTAV